MTAPVPGSAALAFVKAHGTGNDFVLLPDPQGELALTAALTRALCDRHLGLGGDGAIRLAPGEESPGDPSADVFMDYRNADGSVAEMCGNGVRCVAKYVVDRAPGLDRVRVGSRAGTKEVAVVSRHPDGRVDRLRVDMGAPEVLADDHPLTVGGTRFSAVTVSMGNPHAVLVVEDVDIVPLARLGPAIETHTDFGQGTNVEVIAPLGGGRIAGRIWERGVGETLASGTGASAMAVAAHQRGLVGREVTVTLPGGTLDVRLDDPTLWVTGPAVEVASGQLDPAWWGQARAGEAESTGDPAPSGDAPPTDEPTTTGVM
ncbi:diaminopimelate epimerase [Egibacter rhizosphaerae]|uniref:Diaminopimelate epimerase n=1 Tax=Egibacter rhizosphaerae TaxID=1670831 RepID=A0A411YJ29_9ACTN|nr:diaminopimelate epimerase [Egibacter rhizosphaerae]QBI21288.1 diaminopimelate epimerase [Egibacter rhizosphaerae]